MLDSLIVDLSRKEIYKTQSKVIRGWKPQNGDIFTIAENRVIYAMQCSNQHHIFVPIERCKEPIWYKPSTWFRWLWKIQYVEFEKGDQHAD